MQNMYYIGLDVHKRAISYCLKDGTRRPEFLSGLQPTQRRLRLRVVTPVEVPLVYIEPLSQAADFTTVIDQEGADHCGSPKLWPTVKSIT